MQKTNDDVCNADISYVTVNKEFNAHIAGAVIYQRTLSPNG